MTRPFHLSSMSHIQDRFSRQITDGIHIEPSAPIEPYWKTMASGLGFATFIVIVILVASWG